LTYQKTEYNIYSPIPDSSKDNTELRRSETSLIFLPEKQGFRECPESRERFLAVTVCLYSQA
jgi:hypothetical protein